jgi:hypothetical protein
MTLRISEASKWKRASEECIGEFYRIRTTARDNLIVFPIQLRARTSPLVLHFYVFFLPTEESSECEWTCTVRCRKLFANW